MDQAVRREVITRVKAASYLTSINFPFSRRPLSQLSEFDRRTVLGLAARAVTRDPQYPENRVLTDAATVLFRKALH